MLLEFSVKNFRCFQNKVTFSFEAMDDMPEDWLTQPQSRCMASPHTPNVQLNTVNAIYGVNASGKSSLLLGLWQFFRLIIASRKIDEDDSFNLDCFDTSQPVELEIGQIQVRSDAGG